MTKFKNKIINLAEGGEISLDWMEGAELVMRIQSSYSDDVICEDLSEANAIELRDALNDMYPIEDKD